MSQQRLEQDPQGHETPLGIIDRYKISSGFSRLSDSTRITYGTDLKTYLDYCQARLNPSDPLNPQSILDYFNELKKMGISQSLFNRKRSSIGHFIHWSVDEGINDGINLRLLPEHFRGQRDSKKNTPLNREQVETLIDNVNSPRDKAIILLILGTGASTGEILNLNTEDILRTPDKEAIITYKGRVRRRQPRKIKVGRNIADAVFEYIDSEEIEPSAPLFQPNNALGRLRCGQHRMTRAGLDIILKGYASKIGVQNLNATILRNTFISNFSGGIRELRNILGQTRLSRQSYLNI